jgi:hypothetical protein
MDCFELDKEGYWLGQHPTYNDQTILELLHSDLVMISCPFAMSPFCVVSGMLESELVFLFLCPLAGRARRATLPFVSDTDRSGERDVTKARGVSSVVSSQCGWNMTPSRNGTD